MNYAIESGAANEYRRLAIKHEIESASPHRLIQLLMERVLAKIAIAGGHMKRSAINEKGRHISDAINIISGLQASLNHDVKSTLSGNFDRLYDYMSRRLVEANLNNDPEILQEVSGLMGELKEAWDAIADEVNNTAVEGANAAV